MLLTVNDGGYVQVLNSDLTFLGVWRNGCSRFGGGGIACDSTGKVYVLDTYNPCVRVFTAEGKFLRMFDCSGGADGREDIESPAGIAVDNNGVVYVSYPLEDCISVFTPEGVFVMSFGSEGKRPGQFDHPNGLCVDNSGVLYVCERYNNRVQVF